MPKGQYERDHGSFGSQHHLERNLEMTDIYTKRANIRNIHKMNDMSDAELLSLVALNEKIAAEHREPFGSIIAAASASAIAAEAFRVYYYRN